MENKKLIKISDYAKKPFWERRKHHTITSEFTPIGVSNREYSLKLDSQPKYLLTQRQLVNELVSTSHIVYDVHHRSNRPKYRYDESKKKNVIEGYEDVERISIALQRMILTNKTTHSFGNDIWFGDEGKDTDSKKIAKFKSHWNVSGMRNALIQFGEAAFGTGDSAIYIYKDGDGIGYKVFNYMNGDYIAPAKYENGKNMFVRMFSKDGIQSVELYKDKDIELWMAEDVSEDYLLLNYPNAPKEKSEDGYILVARIPHGFSECPVAYHRERDVCWGDGQENIEKIEDLLSNLFENGKYYNFQIMFIKGESIALPQANFQGKVIGSRTGEGDAKILEPADASNTYTLSLNNAFQALWDSTNTVAIRPSELKGGDYSGAYLANLYFPETKWAMAAYARIDPFMKKLLRIFKEAVGIIEKDITSYQNLPISYRFTPYVPKNALEDATIINNSYISGTISRQTATEELEFTNPNEMTRLEDDDKRKLELAMVNKADPTPTPPIDNKAKS